MIFICAQPATLFYAWQVEVMLESFLKKEIDPNNIHIVCSKGNDFYEGWNKLVDKYSDVNFFFYEDTRKNKIYASSIRPNILKQHFDKNPQLESETFFYHDCDIIITGDINWDQYLNDDVWYGSDCCDYISHDHILSKGADVLNEMCRITDIDKNVLKENQNNSIGAQYILKNINSKFWEDVENDSENLYKEITDFNTKRIEHDPMYSGIVIYCADMWALLWNGWKIGRKTECHQDLSFCWAPRTNNDFESHKIFHNAGIQNFMQNQYFYKYKYLNELPYSDELTIDTDTASYRYWQEIKETGKNTVLY